ncbi:glycosyltransferase family 2 protein [uncultured Jatrophihabitans sp.]|uniref:glycosyltransferase family 2 protein n=1 Tax=uncultured Jatrophihabitans sp. TaxID=1610747 RepID=UPI0035C9FBE4
MRSGLVTIVIPAYNYGRFLAEALDSALAQTYPDVEVIVVDDGSTDDTAAVAARYADRISYVYQANAGAASARNTGACQANGEYVIFLDADNMLDEHYIEKTLGVLGQQPPSVGYVYTQLARFGAEEGISQYPGFLLDYLRVRNYIDACCLLRASVLADHRYDTRFTALEDWDFYLSLAEDGIVGLLLNEPLLLYRVHADGVSVTDRITARSGRRLLRRLRRKHWRLYGIAETALFSSRVRYSRQAAAAPVSTEPSV